MSLRRFDIPLLRGFISWRAPQVLYYACRASAMVFIVLTMISYAAAQGQSGPLHNLSCDRIVQAILAFAIIQVTLSTFVLAFRCMALYRLQWTVVGTLSLMMALQFSFAIPVITTVPWTKGFPLGAEHCLAALGIADKSRIWCGINYAWTAVVDITVLLLSIHRLTSVSRSGNARQLQGIGPRTLDYWTKFNSARSELARDGNKSMVQFLIDQGVGAVLLTLLFNMPVMILEFVHVNGMSPASTICQASVTDIFQVLPSFSYTTSPSWQTPSSHATSSVSYCQKRVKSILTNELVSLNDHSRKKESSSYQHSRSTDGIQKSTIIKQRVQEVDRTSSQIELNDRWETQDQVSAVEQKV